MTSLAYKATVDDTSRFVTSKALGAHLGLTPRVYQSGEIDRSGHISKRGDRMPRHLLYEAASVLMTRTRKWSRLRAWGISVAKRPGNEARYSGRRAEAGGDHAPHLGDRRQNSSLALRSPPTAA